MSNTKQKYDFTPQLENASNVHRIELSLIPDNSLILDVGCHSGILGEVLQARKKATVIGIDTDSEALKIAEGRLTAVFNINMESGQWVEQLQLSQWPAFDVIIFGDVLEHTSRPDLILQAARKLLKPKGRIVVSIPNVGHWRVRFGLLFGKFEYAASGILDATHLRFYTRRSGKELLERCGYSIIASDVAGYRLPHWLLKLFPGLLAIQLVYAATGSSIDDH